MAAFEVIALDTATPQLRAPGASDTYTFPRAVELPLGTANGVLYLNGSKVVTSGSALVFDSSGNLGLGVTPSAWESGQRAFDFGITGTIKSNTSTGSGVSFGNNCYYGSSSWRYKQSSQAAALYDLSDTGEHRWFTSTDPTPTAGDPISFSQVMTLDASGRLGIGVTSPNFLLDVAGDTEQQAEFARTGTTTGASYARFVNFGGSMYIGVDSSVGGRITDATTPYAAAITTSNATPLIFGTNNTERARITSGGSLVVGTAALATTATDGFLYVPTCAGTPTGTPTTQTGTAPIVVDTTNNKLYFYSGGQWRDAGP